MKILHVTKKYPHALGGDAVVVSHLEHQQVKLGNEVFIVTHNSPETVPHRNIRKFGMKVSSSDLDKITVRRLLSLLSLPFSGFRCLKNTRPDIIHSHSPDLGFAISLPARLLGIPVINTCHGISFTNRDVSRFKRYAELFFLKYGAFSRIITVDRTSLAALQQHGISTAVYIPNGVDLEFWERKPNEPRGENTTVTFLFAGRLEEEKGLHYLLEAVRKLGAHLDDFTLQIVGDGSQRRQLEELVVTSGMSDRVKFCGSRDQTQMRDMYLNADIFVLPSLHEGMPLALLEAWACALPVIVTNVGNIPFICTHMKNAFIVEPKNTMQLLEAMLTLAQDRDLRKELGVNGNTLVHEKYSWDTIARATAEIYEGVCGR